MTAMNRPKIFDEDSEKGIRKLLVGRSIESVSGDSLFLDDGTMLTVRPNIGCICGSGEYRLDELNHVKNVITDVELCDEYRDDADLLIDYAPRVYRIYVIANGIRSLLMQVSGDDGNGYYGTGYEIYVEYPEIGGRRPDELTHAKPRTIEDVLDDYRRELVETWACTLDDEMTDAEEEITARYADELRGMK